MPRRRAAAAAEEETEALPEPEEEPEEEETSEEEEPEEDEEEEPEEEEVEEEEEDPPPAAAAPPATKSGRPRLKPGPKPGKKPAPPIVKRTRLTWSPDAGEAWEQLLARMGKVESLKQTSPFDIDIRVARGDTNTQITVIPGGSVTGASGVGGTGVAPSEALRDAIIDIVHLPLRFTQGRYTITFASRADHYRIITKGTIDLPSGEQIAAMRRARLEMEQRAGAAGKPPVAMPQPPPMPAPGFPPGYPIAPVGYGAPPPSPPAPITIPPGMPPEMVQMLVEHNNAWRQQFEQLQARMFAQLSAPPPAAPPPPPGPSIEEIVERVAVRLGVGAPPAQVTPAAPPPTPTELASNARREVDAFATMFDAFGRMQNLVNRANRQLGGGAPMTAAGVEVEDGDDDAPPVPAPAVDPKKGWTAEEVHAAARYKGHQILKATRPDGTLDIGGTVVSNAGLLLEVGLEHAGPLIASLANRASKIMEAPEPPKPSDAPGATVSPTGAPRTDFPTL